MTRRKNNGFLLLSLLALALLFIVAGSGLLSARPAREPRAPYAPGEVLVKFREGAGEWERDRARAMVRGAALSRHDRMRYERMAVGSGESVEDAVMRLRADPAVEFAEPNWRVVPLAPTMARSLPGDPLFASQWHLDTTPIDASIVPGGAATYPLDVDLDAPEAWAVLDAAFSFTTAAVGVLDSGLGSAGFFSAAGGGFIPNHEDLPRSVLFVNPVAGVFRSNDPNGWDFIADSHSPADGAPDGFPHGTFVSGLIGAQTDNGVGIAGAGFNRIKILPLRCVGGAYVSQILDAIGYATDLKGAGADLSALNASFYIQDALGNPVPASELQSLQAAITAAGQAGLLFVAAAGNDGTDNDSAPFYPASFSQTLANVLAVANYGPDSAISTVSNYGENTVQVAAPGTDIRSTGGGTNGYEIGDGTSFSSPLAAGVAALVMKNFPGTSPSQAIHRVVDGGVFQKSYLGKLGSAKRVNLLGAIAPFHPYSGYVFLGDTAPVTLYQDATSALYGSIGSAVSSTASVAVMRRVSGSAWAVSPTRGPGLASFTLSFPGSAAGGMTAHKTGPFRVTAIAPFWGRLHPGDTLGFISAPGFAGTWQVSDTRLAAIDAAGVFTAISNGSFFASVGEVRVRLVRGGKYLDESGPVYIQQPPSSGGGGGGGGCFIATAAFGSPLAAEVAALRGFRDRFLLTNGPGRAFVSLYYRFSPPAAEWISRHRAARALARCALYPVVFTVGHPVWAGFALLGAGILAIARRRRAVLTP